jgi:hypothetical protein
MLPENGILRKTLLQQSFGPELKPTYRKVGEKNSKKK